MDPEAVAGTEDELERAGWHGRILVLGDRREVAITGVPGLDSAEHRVPHFGGHPVRNDGDRSTFFASVGQPDRHAVGILFDSDT